MQKLRENIVQDTTLDTRREKNKRRTRQAIRAAAIELFTKQGFADTTVEQIAAAAEISTRTFFNYFDTKEQAVSLPYGLRAEASISAHGQNDNDSWQSIEAACLTLATALEADTDERPTLIAGIRLCQREPMLRDQASAQRGRWEQLMLSSLDQTLVNRVRVNAAAGATWASLSIWAENNGSASLVQTVREALGTISPNN